MKAGIRILLILCLLGNVSVAIGQQETVATLLKKVSEYYQNAASYKINTQYKMYKGLTGNEVTEKYSGYLIKRQDVYQLKLGNNEMLTVGNKQIAIDHDQKMIVYRKSDKTTSSSLIDITGFLEYYKELSIQEEKGSIKCELVAKEEKLSLPYAKITLFIDPDNYSIKKQEMYFSSQLPFTLDNGDVVSDFGRMEVLMREENGTSQNTPSLKDYVLEDNKGQKRLVDAFKDYQFIDETEQ